MRCSLLNWNFYKIFISFQQEHIYETILYWKFKLRRYQRNKLDLLWNLTIAMICRRFVADHRPVTIRVIDHSVIFIAFVGIESNLTSYFVFRTIKYCRHCLSKIVGISPSRNITFITSKQICKYVFYSVKVQSDICVIWATCCATDQVIAILIRMIVYPCVPWIIWKYNNGIFFAESQLRTSILLHVSCFAWKCTQ